MKDATQRALEREARKEIQEQTEHRDALLAISALMKTREGRSFFKYLFKAFEVMTLPDPSLSGNVFFESLGFLRAGKEIYKLACEANSDEAATLLSELEKERYADKYEQYRIDNGLYDDRE